MLDLTTSLDWQASMSTSQNRLPSGREEHHRKAESMPNPRIAVVTVSDTRTPETDLNGQYLKQQILAEGLILAAYHVVRDDPEGIGGLLDSLAESDVQVILFNGGTGLSRRDTTYDVLSGRLEKTLPGFGELFRMLSFSEVGAAAMFSRATAGVYHGKVIIATPGSPAAVQLAWEKLIAPEIRHLAWEITR